ncbi:MAG TPA: hypothetical protein VKY90_12715 [Candidatus Dormibacteraeota bacterium]|nr:hypothetical protein [Candidatus Dormibacteraeota bacterium]
MDAIAQPTQPGTADVAPRKGRKESSIKVTSVGCSPQGTDLVGLLTVAGAQTATMTPPFTDPLGCVNVAKAVQQPGITRPVVSNP